MNCSPSSPQAPLSIEFSRQEYWSGLPFPSPGTNINTYIILIEMKFWRNSNYHDSMWCRLSFSFPFHLIPFYFYSVRHAPTARPFNTHAVSSAWHSFHLESYRACCLTPFGHLIINFSAKHLPTKQLKIETYFYLCLYVYRIFITSFFHLFLSSFDF